jgi:hypothetical protein
MIMFKLLFIIFTTRMMDMKNNHNHYVINKMVLLKKITNQTINLARALT